MTPDTPKQTSSTKTKFLYGIEVVVMIGLAVYAFSCGVMGSIFVYPDNQWIGTGVCMAALVYLNAIGSGTKWGFIIPAVLATATVSSAVLLGNDPTEWFDPSVFFSLAPSVAALVLYSKGKQAWLYPVAAACSLFALVAQVYQLCAETNWIWLLDTLALLVVCAETGIRSYTALRKNKTFYVSFILKH